MEAIVVDGHALVPVMLDQRLLLGIDAIGEARVVSGANKVVGRMPGLPACELAGRY